MSTTAVEATEEVHESGHRAMVGLLWVAVLLLGGLFVVDAIGALETEPDECFAYAYGSGPGGYGCNPLLGDAYFEVDQTDDLVDRQTVHVDGFLFDANKSFGIVQCSGVAFTIPEEPSGVTACDLSTVALGSTDANGSLSTDMRLRRIITTPDAGEVDCGDPDASCVIAGGVLGFDGMSTTEAAFTPISFDPAVPPVPPPTLTIEIVDIDADTATLLVECRNAVDLWIDVQLQQEINGLYGAAYGYVDGSDNASTCAGGPAEFEITLEPGSRRIGRGDVTYQVYGYASDGFESVSTGEEGQFEVRRTPRPSYLANNEPGDDIRIELLGTSGYGRSQRVRLAITCDRPFDTAGPDTYSGVWIQVSQWSGLDRVYGYGDLSLDQCDGRTIVSVPLVPSNGRLTPGAAQLHAGVYVESYGGEIDEYYFDQATLADKVRLRGWLTADLPETTENPDSRITIEQVTRAGVTGTIDCDGADRVDLQFSAQQYQGRVIRDAYAYAGLECEGTVEFDVEWSSRLSTGTTAVNAYANGYTIDDDWEPPVYPTVTYPMVSTTTAGPPPSMPLEGQAFGFGRVDASDAMSESDESDESVDYGGYFEYRWFDQQGITLRVKR